MACQNIKNATVLDQNLFFKDKIHQRNLKIKNFDFRDFTVFGTREEVNTTLFHNVLNIVFSIFLPNSVLNNFTKTPKYSLIYFGASLRKKIGIRKVENIAF